MPRKMNKAPSGPSQCVRGCWRVLRNYMCTSGWYPLFVALIITAGFLLSLYSSAGCEFIDLQVGFTPNNAAWNQSQAELGLFYYQDRSAGVTEGSLNNNKIFSSIFPTCVKYTDTFQESIIDQDRTWKVARVMAMIAVGSSLLAALTAWLIVFVPVPTNYIWPGIMLPNAMISLIAEGSKFLFFDIALCHNAVWLPSGANSLPEQARSCQLSDSSYYGIGAASIYLIVLLSVCVKAPKKRDLDPSFGIRQGMGDEFVEVSDSRENFEDAYGANDIEEDPSILDEDLYTDGPSPTTSSMLLKRPEDEPDYTSQDDSSDPCDESNNNSSSFPMDESPPRVSESRMAAMSKMDVSASMESFDMIDQLNTDLDASLADDRYDWDP